MLLINMDKFMRLMFWALRRSWVDNMVIIAKELFQDRDRYCRP